MPTKKERETNGNKNILNPPLNPNMINQPCPTIYLFQKWAYKVEKGWYGFSLEDAPFAIGIKIDEFLTWVNENIPEFKILQIKTKFGSLRIYLQLNNDAHPISNEIMDEYYKRYYALTNPLLVLSKPMYD